MIVWWIRANSNGTSML